MIELPAWDAPRDCEYCGLEFAPKRVQDKDQRFCCANHRKDYHRYGAKDRVRKALRSDLGKEITLLTKRLGAVEETLRKLLIDNRTKDVVTLQHEEHGNDD